MKTLTQAFLTALCLATLSSSLPAWAKGQISVEHSDGDTDIYSEVEIYNTKDIIYFKTQDGESILMITKNQCNPEGEILVCNQARMGLDTEGVIEELEIKQIFLFINPTSQSQPIKGSQVTMSPGTILFEAVTGKDIYVTGLGKIDFNTKPEGASK